MDVNEGVSSALQTSLTEFKNSLPEGWKVSWEEPMNSWRVGRLEFSGPGEHRIAFWADEGSLSLAIDDFQQLLDGSVEDIHSVVEKIVLAVVENRAVVKRSGLLSKSLYIDGERLSNSENPN